MAFDKVTFIIPHPHLTSVALRHLPFLFPSPSPSHVCVLAPDTRAAHTSSGRSTRWVDFKACFSIFCIELMPKDCLPCLLIID